MAYTDNQINDFLELAQEVGITKAKRELGYPKSWSTAQYWAKQRNVKVAVDEVMQKTQLAYEQYKIEEVITIAQEGMNRVYDQLMNNNSLDADSQKKLSEAFVKHYNVWANAQGKATNINENRESAQTDLEAHLQDLINAEKAKNILRKSVTEESESLAAESTDTES